MCGIVGGNRKQWNYEKAVGAIGHRGPDGTDIYRGEGFSLGFARLAIIDLSPNAMQPMADEDGKVRIVYNGEIYNYKSLRRKLEKNFLFRTVSDTEVVLAAYLQYGDSFVQYMDGMFAIAIFDERVKKVKLFRDRAGVKPLYYYYDGKNFAFCSELKGILALECREKWEIDHTALYDYLTYQYIPEPKSLYKYVYKLQPAHWMEYDLLDGKLSKQSRYWKIRVNDNQGGTADVDEAAYELKRILAHSVKQQLNADVAVGILLSGGIDSSIVTREAGKQDKDILAFSVGFQDGRYSEIQYAREAAEYLGVGLVERICDRGRVTGAYGKIKQWFDEPFADTSCYPTYMVCGLAKKKVRVVLTGDGGDELFCGYTSYGSVSRIWNKMKHIPYWVRKPCSGLVLHSPLVKNPVYRTKGTLLGAKGPGRLYEISYETDPLIRKISKTHGDIPYKYNEYEEGYLEETNHNVMLMDLLMYHPDDILVKVDRAAMAVSLETRVPMLDKHSQR